MDIQKSLLEVLNTQFPKSYLYSFSNLSYPGGLWSFTFASKGLDPIKDFNPQRVVDSRLEFEYYNKELHRACFALPNFVRKGLCDLIANS